MNLKSVLDRIIPTEEEEAQLREVVAELLQAAQSEISRLDVDATPFLTGSVEKHTHLKNPEIDIFIGFSPDIERDDLERFGLEIGEAIVTGRKMFAEHPYIHGEYKGFEVDVVPCYRLDSASDRMTAVDRTPFHAKYVMAELKEGQENEVRLFKRFAKGVGIYGAEAKIQGLSGYLCELLVLSFGTFEELIKSVAEWGGSPVLELVPAKKRFTEPLVVIDPVDPKRNVASAVSQDQLSTFIRACQEYLIDPSEKFFFPNELKPLSEDALIAEMDRRGTHFVCVETPKPDITDDVLYPQIRKMNRAVVDLCENEGFAVLDSRFDVTDTEIILLLEFEIWSLPLTKKHEGPPTSNENSSRFLEKWSGSPNAMSEPFIEQGRWMVFTKRQHTEVGDLLKDKLLELSLGKDVQTEAKKSIKVREGHEVANRRLGLTKMLDKRFPWEY